MSTTDERRADDTAGDESPHELARRYGLIKVGADIPLTEYLRQLWQRRYFITGFARARIQSENARNRLGEVWLVLNPVLNAAVFYLIFGVILKTSRGIENYVAFLITGVFLFTYLQRSVTAGATSVSGNLGLIRAFHFPRAVLPLATTMKLLMQLGYSMVVLLLIVLATGEPITWRWLLLPITIALLTFFASGMALITARVTTAFNDFTNLLPFLLRTWLYLSGVFFSIAAFSERFPPLVGEILLYQPGSIYLECARYSLLSEQEAVPYMFAAAVGWAALAFGGGFLYFFRAEGRYGRG